MTEAVSSIALVVMAVLAVSVIVYIERIFLKARLDIEKSWVTLVHHQQATIESLRNRLMTHSWEQFHNVQSHTPQAQDRVNPALLPDMPRVSVPPDDSSEEFEEALRESGMDLEGSDWQPTVGGL